jgi:hypothetical protein
MSFAIEVFQNREIGLGQGAVEAILTVTANVEERIADASLHIWTPISAHDLILKQVHPLVDDLSASGTELSEQVRAFPIGAWSPGESRDFYLALQVLPSGMDDEMLAARASVAYQDSATHPHEDRPAHRRVFAHWTSDQSLFEARDPHVVHYATRLVLVDHIQRGLQLRNKGDEVGATQLLGHAVKLAHEAGDVETSARLQQVVDVEDPVGGTVALKRHVDATALAELETGMTQKVSPRAARPETPTP